MSKLLRTAVVTTALLLPLGLQTERPTQAQERQGCYLINQSGRLIDLSTICPVPTYTVQPQRSQTLGTGDIQVTLRWTTTDDLDLAVTDPAGNTVTYFNPQVPSRGQLDVDANAGCSEPTTSPIENIFWPPSQAPRGQYKIEVNLYSRCNPGNTPIPFTLTLLVQGNTRTIQGTVSTNQPIASIPFSLPSQTAQQR